MYINLNALVHTLAVSMFEQTFLTTPPENMEEFDAAQIKALALFCEIDLMLENFPPSWVEVTGKEEYVKRSLLDIS